MCGILHFRWTSGSCTTATSAQSLSLLPNFVRLNALNATGSSWTEVKKERHTDWSPRSDPMPRLFKLRLPPWPSSTGAARARAGCRHAGEFLANLLEDDSEEYERLLLARNTDFGDEPTYQPIHRQLAHLIEIMMYRIDLLTGGEGLDMAVSEKDARHWLKVAGLAVRL